MRGRETALSSKGRFSLAIRCLKSSTVEVRHRCHSLVTLKKRGKIHLLMMEIQLSSEEQRPTKRHRLLSCWDLPCPVPGPLDVAALAQSSPSISSQPSQYQNLTSHCIPKLPMFFFFFQQFSHENAARLCTIHPRLLAQQ